MLLPHWMLSSVTVYGWDLWRGLMTELQTISTLPADFKGKSTTAEIRIHPESGHLYVSNRGHDSITNFEIGKDGKLTFVDTTPSGGHTPRNFNFDPTGKWLLAAHQDSGTQRQCHGATPAGRQANGRAGDPE